MAKNTGVRDKTKTAAFVAAYGKGAPGAEAARSAGYTDHDAGHAAARAMSDSVVRDQVLDALRATAVTWHRLVTRAKEGLFRNLDKANWEPRLVTKTNRAGEKVSQLMPPLVKASDINTAAKVVLDSLRTIDAGTLSEKAAVEDRGYNVADRALKILGDHGVN